MSNGRKEDNCKILGTRKDGGCSIWKNLIEPSKRGKGRPRLIRIGQAGKSPKEYHSIKDNTTDGQNK